MCDSKDKIIIKHLADTLDEIFCLMLSIPDSKDLGDSMKEHYGKEGHGIDLLIVIARSKSL